MGDEDIALHVFVWSGLKTTSSLVRFTSRVTSRVIGFSGHRAAGKPPNKRSTFRERACHTCASSSVCARKAIVEAFRRTDAASPAAFSIQNR